MHVYAVALSVALQLGAVAIAIAIRKLYLYVAMQMGQKTMHSIWYANIISYSYIELGSCSS